MDQKRLLLAIAISIAILVGFQLARPRPPAHAPDQTTTQDAGTTPRPTAATPLEGSPGQGAAPATQTAAAPREVPRLKIAAPRVQGSVSLLGARIDDIVLTDYRETLDPHSPLVRLLEPRSEPKPYYVQYGWSAPAGVKVPDNDTVWTASAPELVAGKPVTLSWDNGAGLVYELVLSVDDNYMFAVDQRVRNATGAPVKVFPWARIRRDYQPQVSGYYILFEGMLGVENGTLQEVSYSKAKTESEKHADVNFDTGSAGGWAGITDKYWLTALIPDQRADSTVTFRHIGDQGDHYQVDYALKDAQTVPPGGEASSASHLFAGAKVVSLLDRYESEYHIPNFDKAVDFGWFYFLTKPIFYALDWLNSVLGNFGLAIMVFTVFAKAVFFPLANYSYRSMSRMKLLGPKMASLRERLKDDPAKLQQEMMALYKAEKVNPASGCLPMLVQIPVFFSLYKVIFVTIEMRQAPFFGWIHDLSQVDPTNVFNLFGLLPFDPTTIAPFLHLGAWPLIMGCTMFFQQRLNPPPPDPVQARIFQFMPIVFTFMLANFPAGLVIYWSWNNTLSILQQWLIQRRTRLPKPGLART
jgi:YidC/Oxa1 family membrane protein insertase